MLTHTLFYVAAIIGLRSTGETFDLNENDKDTINLYSNCTSFNRYIDDYHVTDDDKVSD